MKKSNYWIAFSSIEQIDSTFVQRLYNYFGDIEAAYKASARDLEQIEGLNIKKAKKFIELRSKINLEKTVDEVVKRNVKYLTFEDEKYPQMLKQINNPPVVLYYKGDLDICNLNRTLAVVGSRRASSNARKDLAHIISKLGGTDICVVSGLASGIDTTAHEAALDNNLKTIGVIASGFDYTYPAANKRLYEKIQDGNGAVISEYYPTFEPLKFRFPQRNRIVSGLSSGTLVAEASLKSGALITANLTLEQGRELMCIPGLISNPNTQGIYKLLKNGAAIVTCADDILNTLGWEVQTNKQLVLEVSDLPEDEEKIFKAIEIEPKGVDELLAQTGIKLDNLLTYLTTMELKGIIEQAGTDRYKRVH
ncbi:MAG: DNA-processing protein DprA [Heliobacteriaceae bacterium]|nr:DNA-processing protein DprA [Heliobacteriaceae bacterium]